jgi:1-deoxy-D-xylulose-5-phosphate synthase
MPTLLERVNDPSDLRALPASDLPALAEEVRALLVSVVSRTGGHLGPNLGVVELTIALHRVLRSPHDLIVWDTGHQAYVHKLLTGRRAGFDQIRHAGGLSGYPSRRESPHDLVENSHASTGLSYADGLAKALELRGESDRTVAVVVGDGALTGGMCWEALNNIGAASRPVLVVLNDNGRSYSPTTGACARRLETARRDGTVPALFTDLGLAYVGPVDGHDIAAMEAALRQARGLGRPVVVHCLTQKGRGHLPAEADEVDHMHTLAPPSSSSVTQSWTEALSEELVAIAQERPDVVGITAAMLHPTGLHELARKFPDRVFDVGIAEQHAVASAAGLAMAGMHPVVCIYATFLNRAFDQVLMDVGLHRLPVTFVLDRAGVTGNDGPSHHGMWDLSLLQLVPGLRVAAPRDAAELRRLLREAVDDEAGPTALRYPKGDAGRPIPAVGRLGGGELLAAPAEPRVLLVAVGGCARAAVGAGELLTADGVATTVVDPRWVAPVDHEIVDAAGLHQLVVTVEDGGAVGGVGDSVARALREAQVSVPVRTVALPQRFLPHGSRADLLGELGLDAAGIADAVRTSLS